MATFRLRFEGLCHFVENKDQKALCRMCVVMPDASGHDLIPDHISKLVLKDATVKREGRHDSEVLLAFLRRQRVSFEFFRNAQPLPQEGGDFEFGAEGRRGIIAMDEIAGIFADQNLDVVSAFPPNDVQAQILLGRGKFKVDPDGGETSWNIPGGLNGSIYDTRKEVANQLYLEVEGIDWVRVYIEPFERTSPLVAAPGGEPDLIVYDLYPAKEDGVIELFASNDCNLKTAIEIATLAEPREDDTTDYDFRFHYKVLNSSTLTAIERLGIDLPLPSRVGAEAQRSEPVGELRALLGQTIRPEEQKIDWMSFLKGLVGALEELLNSTSGCNCLRGGGTTRLFDLDYFIPTSVVTNSSKTAAPPSQLPPGVRRASAP